MATQRFEGVLQYLRAVCRNPGDEDLTDAELLRRFLTRCEETAFALLVQRHGAMVLGVCRRVLGDAHGAEDSLQATFIVLCRRAASIRCTGSLANWLYGVAQRIALKAKTQMTARQRRERPLTDTPGPEALDNVSLKELRTILDEEIARLADKYRAPIVLCYFEDKSYDQAAKELGWSKSSLAKRLTRARELLRRQLVRRGLALSAGVLATGLCAKVAGAHLPAMLTIKTVKAALSVAAGNALSSACISAPALALAQETMTAAIATKAKALVMVLAFAMAVGGAGWAGYHGLADKSPPAQVAIPKRPAVKEQTGGAAKKDQPAATAPKVATEADLQNDSLPAGAVSRLGSNQGHGRDVAFSPDGRIIAAADYNHQIYLWDAATIKRVGQLTAGDPGDPGTNSRWLHCVAFSPDGKRLVCGEGHPDGRPKTIRVWEVATGKLIHEIVGHESAVLAVAFSPTANVFASASADQTACLWDGATGRELHRLRGHTGMVQSVAFSPDGKALATSGDDLTIRLWDVASGQELLQLVGHQDAVMSVCFSPDGKSLASASRDQTVRLWNTASGEERAVSRGHEREVARVCFAPDGKTVASASKDKTIQLWDAATGANVGSMDGGQKELSSLSFSPSGKMLVSAGGGLSFWDLATRKKLTSPTGHRDVVAWLQFREGGSTLASMGRDNTIRSWDWKSGNERRSVPLPKMSARGSAHPRSGIAFGPQLTPLALSSPRGGMFLVDPASGAEVGRLGESEGRVISASYSPDGKLLVSTDGKRILLWDASARKLLRDLPEEPGGTKCVLFAPNGNLLLGGNKSSRMWDLAKDQLVGAMPLPFTNVWSVEISSDSHLLFCGDSAGEVQVWDLDKGAKARVFKGVAGFVQTLAFSPDRRLLAAGGWGTTVWELATGQKRFGFPGSIAAVAFAPDGRNLATGSWNGPILVWDIPGKALAIDSSRGDDKQIMQTLWNDLASEDGARVHQAIWGLVGRSAKSVIHLRTLLKPVPAADIQHFGRLSRELDSESYPVRENASKELQRLGEQAEPALNKLLADPPSLEVKLRAQLLLDKIALASTSPERMQPVRAIEALEYMATPAARQLLQELAHGAPAARLTREAAVSLERLKTIPR